MPNDTREMKFLATPEKGEVSALLIRPENATHLLVLGHGASTDMRHATLQSIAERLAEVGIATFRYNFPYSEHGKGRDGQAVCTATIRSAVAAAGKAAPDLPLLAGGHSFSGRMTSTAASESPLEGVRGLVFFSFPLHLAGKPETKRADHLDRRHRADALPERDARRTGDSGPAEAGLREAREPRDAPSPRHGRPRLQGPQEVPHERGGRLRRDGSRRTGVGGKIAPFGQRRHRWAMKRSSTAGSSGPPGMSATVSGGCTT